MQSDMELTQQSAEAAATEGTARALTVLVTSMLDKHPELCGVPIEPGDMLQFRVTSRRSRRARSASGPTVTLPPRPQRSGWPLLASLAGTLATPISGEPVTASYAESAWRLSIQSRSSTSRSPWAGGRSVPGSPEHSVEIEVKLSARRVRRRATSSSAPTVWRAEALYGDSAAVSRLLSMAYHELSKRIAATS